MLALYKYEAFACEAVMPTSLGEIACRIIARKGRTARLYPLHMYNRWHIMTMLIRNFPAW